MNVDLQDFIAFTEALSKVSTPETIEVLRLCKDENIYSVLTKDDRYITMGVAAKVLGVNSTTISHYVRDGRLVAYYVPDSSVRRFLLSEVKALARREPYENHLG